MQFLALSVDDLDIPGPRASSPHFRFAPALSAISNCTETDVPPRNFTAIEHAEVYIPVAVTFYARSMRIEKMCKDETRFIKFPLPISPVSVVK